MTEKDKFQITYNILKDRIMYGSYHDGEHLVIETLSNEFGIGRSVTRRVLETLEKQGIIENVHSRGFFVKCPHAQSNLLGLRRELEIAAIGQVVEKITENELSNLRKLANAADKYKTEQMLAEYVDAEVDFHKYLVACSYNSYLINMHNKAMDGFKQYLSNYFNELSSMYSRVGIVENLMSHKVVVESIRLAAISGNTDNAVQILKIHLTPEKGILSAIDDSNYDLAGSRPEISDEIK